MQINIYCQKCGKCIENELDEAVPIKSILNNKEVVLCICHDCFCDDQDDDFEGGYTFVNSSFEET